MRDPEEALLISSGCLATDQRAKLNHADTKKALAIIAKCLFCLACLVGRGNLKQVGIYLFFLVNNLLVNLLGIPVGTLRGLDSDGRCFLSSAP
ncbi:hypothetical protein IB254_12240 [Pseudomonas sp. PDM03]|uniref:hypothetical protein n=1 Tax=Pseudomonas sp. PDM03 TaxID=2769266 RepID=UPI001786B2DA|nr:hypothetical protein [Pseudomonas sp. PDM03]MBD9587828.1 hypothetical protein [Pseudomonas sp. PDM03]